MKPSNACPVQWGPAQIPRHASYDLGIKGVGIRDCKLLFLETKTDDMKVIPPGPTSDHGHLTHLFILVGLGLPYPAFHSLGMSP